MVVHPVEGTSIDLDHDTKFRCGLVYVNRQFRDTWRDRFLFENKFVLNMTTAQIHSTFDDFKLLQTFLRKTYVQVSSCSIGKPDTITARIVTRDKDYRQHGPSYVLGFETDSAVSLADVRINVLPFIMETSTTQATNTVMFPIWTTPSTEGPSTLTTSHTMPLHKLRLNIVLAMMTHAYSDPRNLHPHNKLPDIWINGFGEVVQVDNVDEAVGGAWESASELDAIDNNDGGFKMRTLHPMDVHYRFNHVSWKKNVTLSDAAQFFPFRRKVDKILPYLIKIVDRAGLYKAMLGG